MGWTKTLPVTIGRPRLRIVTHGLETLVAIPLVAVLGAEWGATGAAVAVLVSTFVFGSPGSWSFCACTTRCRRPRCRCSRESGRRVRYLAPRSRGSRESCSGARRLPRRPRAPRRGRDDGGLGAGRAPVSRRVGERASPLRHVRAARSCARPRGPTSSTPRA
jgi:hypothetical protein